jgi:hypothetical protein
MKSGDIVRRKDGKQISSLLANGGITATVAVGPGEHLGIYAWHYPQDVFCPANLVGLKIGLFPTWDNCDEYEVVK